MGIVYNQLLRKLLLILLSIRELEIENSLKSLGWKSPKDTCRNCKHYLFKMDGGYCNNPESPCYMISILPYFTHTFSCSLHKDKK